MPYANGMITASTPYGVSVPDVQNAVGSTSGSIGILCTRASIKTWAKFRPLEYKTSGATGSGRVKPVPDNERQNVNYGIVDIPTWTGGKTVGNMVNFWLGIDMTGNRNRPDGYESSGLPKVGWWQAQLPSTCYRLSDFVSTESPSTMGYFIDANAPVGELDYAGTSNPSSGNATVIYKMGLDGVTAGLTIFYSDLSTMNQVSFKNLYFGVVIYAGTSIYVATQDNKVGDIDGTVKTLWSMGAHVHFRIGANSGAIRNAAMASTAVKVFPILMSKSNDSDYYYGSTDITPVSANLAATFVALQPAEEAVFTMMFVEGVINNPVAYKNRTASTRLVYYSFSLACTDASLAHTFTVKIELRDSSGTALNTDQNNYSVPAGGSVKVSSNIDAGSHYAGATVLYIEAALDPVLDPEPLMRPVSRSVEVWPNGKIG